MTYQEQLQDPRWKLKSAEIKQIFGETCNDCLQVGVPLQTHHCAYVPERKIWEYSVDLLMPLCAPCHRRRQTLEDAIRIEIGKYTRTLDVDELEEWSWDLFAFISRHQTEQVNEGF